MATIQKQAALSVSVDDAWELISAVGRVTALTKFITECRLEGDRRICTFADGGVTDEKVVSVDHDLRRVAYTVVHSPFNFAFHAASMQVLADKDGARIVWTTDISPDPLRAALEPMFDQMFADMLVHVAQAKDRR